MNKKEKLLIEHIALMVQANKTPLIVSQYIYSLMVFKIGLKWCKKNLIADLPVPTTL